MLRGTLVYDADCGFCTRTAIWLSGRSCAIRPWQALDLGAVGLTEADVTAAAYWLDADDRVAERGAGAIALALRARGGPGAIVGRVIAARAVRPVADIVYGWVARHRGALPGGELCTVGDEPVASRSAPWWAPGLYVVVLVAWLVGFSMTAHENEPYPALTQPRFQTVPGESERLDVDYAVTLSDGERVAVDSDDLFPPSAGMELSIANRLLTKRRTKDPQTRDWLASRVAALDLPTKAVDLTVTKAMVVTDHTTGRTTSREVLSTWTVPLGDAP